MTTDGTATLGRWPDPCDEPSCLAHLPRGANDACRCPRYKATRNGYHITKRNLDCPAHGPTGAQLAEAFPSRPQPPAAPPSSPSAVTVGFAALNGGASPTLAYWETTQADAIWAAWNALPDDEQHPVDVIARRLSLRPAQVAAVVYPERIFGKAVDVDDVCHREITGTDDILAPCPQCGHLLAVHVGTDGCPVCIVEMLAARERVSR